MSKKIQGFREKDYGMFIDLTDALSSVSVDRKTGNLVERLVFRQEIYGSSRPATKS